MTRLERIRLTQKEKDAAIMLGTIPVLLFLIVVRLLWKIKRWLFLSSMIFFIGWSFNFLAPHAFSPKADATRPVIIEEPQSEHAQIIAYIKQVFGDQSSNAFKILACENHSLNPDAQGINKDGSVDTGIFQINSFWAKPEVLKDWKTNVDMAYQIYLRGGWSEWSCESVWHALERNDTL